MQATTLQKLLGVSLFVGTAAAVAGYNQLSTLTTTSFTPPPMVTPVVEPVVVAQQEIEVVFAIDTTGSMGGLIAAAKEKIWSIASTMAASESAPNIKMGLVAYRDRGDTYVTRVFDLSEDLDSMYAALMEFQAQGGGDGPESVNQALSDAVQRISWGQNPNAYRAIFLVGDAPGHTDYANEVQFPQLVAQANRKGILINTIRCGNDASTAAQWQQIASLGQGNYFSVDQNGGALALNSPFDARMAELSAQLDATRLHYGDAAAKAKHALRTQATKKLHNFASAATQARRAAFNSLEAGAKNLFGEQDLLVDIAAGKADLNSVAEAELPAELAALPAAERKAKVDALQTERQRLRKEIKELAGRRDNHLAEKAAAAPAPAKSLDYQLFDAIKQQTKDKGLAYGDTPKL